MLKPRPPAEMALLKESSAVEQLKGAALHRLCGVTLLKKGLYFQYVMHYWRLVVVCMKSSCAGITEGQRETYQNVQH